MANLTGRVAIVTGSSAGIGAGIAMQMCRCGAAVVLTGRSEAKGHAVLQAILAEGGVASFVPGNVLSELDMSRLVDEAVKQYGRLDILVASAAGATGRQRNVTGPFEGLDLTDASLWVGESTAAKLIPAQAAARHMVKNSGGSLIFVTSEGGRTPTPGQTAVATYAAGLIMSTKVIAKELAKYRVRANVIAVTMVTDTPFFDEKENSTDWPEERRKQYEKIARRATLGLASPADIGAVASFLASDEASLITGSTISPTGGLTFN